jgi:peroxiredoxin
MLRSILILLMTLFSTTGMAIPVYPTSTPPAVGDKAPDFTLSTVGGKRVRLSDLTAKSPVALIVLRGYPGYQCPFCNMQVQDFLKKSQGLREAGVHIILVYPGPPDNLDARAKEFMVDKKLPDNFDLVLDPGYDFTNLYGLRWDAPKETAYPSTFLIDQKGIVFYAKISKTHGGRTNAAEILDALMKKKAS